MDCRLISFNRSGGLFAATRANTQRLSPYSHPSNFLNFLLIGALTGQDVVLVGSNHCAFVMFWQRNLNLG